MVEAAGATVGFQRTAVGESIEKLVEDYAVEAISRPTWP